MGCGILSPRDATLTPGNFSHVHRRPSRPHHSETPRLYRHQRAYVGPRFRDRYFRDDELVAAGSAEMDTGMTPEDLAARLADLIADARDSGVDDETIAAMLQAAADALKEGLS